MNRHISKVGILHSFEKTFYHSLSLIKGRNNDELICDFRMPDRYLHGSIAAIAEAHYVGLVYLEIFQEFSYIIRILFKAFRCISVFCMSVSLQFYSNHFILLS